MSVLKQCEYCGAGFFVRNYRADVAKYCSQRCYHEASRNSVNIVVSCLKCGSRIETTDMRLQDGRGKFCSRACLASYYHKGSRKPPRTDETRRKLSQSLKGRLAWNKKQPVVKVCETCGSRFEVQPHRKDRARFCSIACRHKHLKTITGQEHPLFSSIKQTCEWCGESFFAKPAKIEVGEGRFCSRNCVGAYVTALQGGRRSSLEVTVEKVLVALGMEFETQKQIGPWVVDFYLPSKNLVIECDGAYWHSLPEVVERDERKNLYLQQHGYTVIRLLEEQIRENALGVVSETIANL